MPQSTFRAAHLREPLSRSTMNPYWPHGGRRILWRVRDEAFCRGFSLVELLVVVSILGILLAIATPSYKAYLIKANQAAAKAVLMEISSRQEQFVMRAGRYGSLVELDLAVPADVDKHFVVTVATGTNTLSTAVALQGLPTFRASASGRAGTIQEGQPAAGAATEYSINQFGLRLPVSAW